MTEAYIDQEILKPYLYEGAYFWCVTDEERVALLTALDELGYEWMSGHELLELTSGDYLAVSGYYEGISYCIMDICEKKIGKSRSYHEGTILVSDLVEANPAFNVLPEDILAILNMEV